MTTDDPYRPRRVAVVVVCDVPAVTTRDAGNLAALLVEHALRASPDVVGDRRHRDPVLRHELRGVTHDVTVRNVVELTDALRHGALALVTLGDPEPLPTADTDDDDERLRRRPPFSDVPTEENT